MKRSAFLASGLAAAALAPRAARAQLRPFQQQLTIVVNAPLSGNAGAAGQQLVTGAQIAIDYANQFTPSLNSAFALRTYDDMGQYAQSLNNVQFASADQTVIAIIGGLDGNLIQQALPTYANAQMPLLVPASTADAVTSRGYRVVWRLPTKDSMEGQLYARFIADRAKPKMAIAVSQTGVYGVDVMNGFTNQSKSAKFNADGYVFPSDSPDFKAAAKRIVSRTPDFVFLCGQSTRLGPLTTALRDAGFTGKFGACEGFYDTQTPQQYGKELDGAFISSSFPPLSHVADATQALTDLRSRTNITIVSAFAYAATQIIMSAVRRTGATNRLSTMTALQAPTPYSTILGQFQFMPTGDPVDPNLYFYTIDGGQYKYVAASHASAFVL